MMLAFNFDREESLRAFEAALKLDPDAPMLRWGIAYALGGCPQYSTGKVFIVHIAALAPRMPPLLKPPHQVPT